MEHVQRLLTHLRAVAPVLAVIFLLMFILHVELSENIYWQALGYDSVIESNVKTFPKRKGPANMTIQRHPWLRQSISQYELMGFDFTRECDDIDLDVYEKELKQRAELGYREHKDGMRVNFVLSSSSHHAGPLVDDYDNILPHAESLPSLIYRCTLESAALMNPAHDIVLYARTKDLDAFIANETASNPAFKVLTELPNFSIVPIPNDREFFTEFQRSTGLSDPLYFLDQQHWRTDKYLGAHLSDLYRLVIMHSQGGVYADLDAISVQDLRRYPSGITWVVSDSNGVPKGPGPSTPGAQEFLVNGVFGDVKGGLLTKVALHFFNRRYRPSKWSTVGPRLMTEVARYIQKRQLGSLELLKTWDFLPIHWSTAQLVTGPLANLSSDQLFAVSHATQLHVFGGATLFFDMSSKPGTSRVSTVLGATMINRCPLTYCQATKRSGSQAEAILEDMTGN